jgi:nucleoside-diphosphate-sugar epimerase
VVFNSDGFNKLVVLVTDGSGYLSGHVIRQLLVHGHVVRCMVPYALDSKKIQHLQTLCPNANPPLEIIYWDMRNTDPKGWEW